jgi:phosphatidylethanolamine-binding protein (PEBP) family uncharacterized protein
VFRVYALGRELDLEEGAARSALEGAMRGGVLAEGELVARYERLGRGSRVSAPRS